MGPREVPMSFMIRITPLLAIVCIIAPVSLVEIPSEAAISSTAIEDNQDTSRLDKNQWTWADQSGRIRTRTELDEMLARHEEWLKVRKGQPPNLEGAKLIGADLRNAKLEQINLANANLSKADLSGSDLASAHLRNANLSEANLTGAALDGAQMANVTLHKATLSGTTCNYTEFQSVDFREAVLGTVRFTNARLDHSNFSGLDMRRFDLKGAVFSSAKLSGADFRATILEGIAFSSADLTHASFSHARLLDVVLAGADLRGADLKGTVFQAVGDLPKARSIAAAKNLEYLTYEDDPEALARLVKEFRETGFREQERKVTYALKRREEQFLSQACWTEGNGLSCLALFLNKGIIYPTVLYGMAPFRAIGILFALLFLGTGVYWCCIHLENGAGLKLLIPAHTPKNRPKWLLRNLAEPFTNVVAGDKPHALSEYMITPEKINLSLSWQCVLAFVKREMSLIWVAFVFSLMSCSNIKFREVDFGRWLKAMTMTEYDIGVFGWAKTFSGIQALSSLLLIVLAVAFYFGRPFE